MRKQPSARGRATRHRLVASSHTRDDILVAAARLMGRRGSGVVSMQAIADEVGFTAPALYGYFESKEAIFAELGRTLERELDETFAPPPPGLSFRARIACLVRRQLEWADRRRDVFLAFMAAHGRGEPHPKGERACGPDVMLDRLSAWIRAAADRPGDLGGRDPGEVACVVMGIAHGFFLRWLVSEPRGSLADQVEVVLDLIFHGIGEPAAAARLATRSAARPPARRRRPKSL